MAILHTTLLLAAYSPIVIGGPVPRFARRLYTSYSNSSQPAGSTSEVVPSSSTFDPSAFSIPTLSLSTIQDVVAETGIVVEPIEHTLVSQTLSAITYLLPNGQPLVTQEPEIVMSTSFFLKTSPTSEEASPTPTSSNMPAASELSSIAVESTDSLLLTSSSVDIKSEAVSQSGGQLPVFTYSPEQPAQEPTLVSSVVVTPSTSIASGIVIVTSPEIISGTPIETEAPVQNATSMPGFDYKPPSPGTNSPIESPAVSSLSPEQTTVSTAYEAPEQHTLSASAISSAVAVVSSFVPIEIVITTTQYTTVYPTPSAPIAPVAPSSTAQIVSSSLPLTSAQSQAAAPPLSLTSTLASELAPEPSVSSQLLSSSRPPALPTTPLEPPPVIIVTQYTTVQPGQTAPPSTLLAPESSAKPPSPVSSKATTIQTIPAVKPTPTPPPSPAAPTPTGIPTSETATVSASETPPPAPPANISAVPAPTSPPLAPTNAPHTPNPTNPPPAPVPAPEPSPESTTEGPLIITPIAPSQIFTVTVTETAAPEKETVTVTVTA